MGNRTTTTTKLLAKSLLLLSPIAAFAAGLGRLDVQSGLGQPLKAEIDVVSVQRNEADSLIARIASPDAFRQAGIEYGAVVPQIRAAVERRADGRHVIVLSTPQAVEEPFVDLLIELNWASGRLVRQYTFLLDPAGYKGPQPIVAPPAVATVPQPAQAKPLEPAKPIQPAPAPRAAAPAAAPATAGSGTYEVKQGDTLSKIAQANRPDGVSMQQMLVALYRANEDAFISKNMNLLRAGRTLNMPDQGAVAAITQADAQRIVSTQTREFNDYRSKVAASVAAAPAGGGETQQRTAGRITTQAEEKPAGAAPAGDQLRLSKPEDNRSGKAASAARDDDLAAREKALKEANDRVSELEKNVNDLQKLLELKNQQLSDLQKQAQAATARTPEALKPAEPPQAAAPTPAPAAEAPKPTEAPKPETPAVAAAPVQPAPVAEAPKPAAEAPKPAPKKPAAPPPEPSFLDSLLDDPAVLAAGGGGLLALLIGGYLWRRKKSATLENSLIGATTTDSSSVFGSTGGRNIDTGASSMQTDFSQSAIGSIDTDEVDPVAEADVYMAYGRDAQAEEILKEALQKDPTRQAVRVKLLEIYAARKDLKAFETTAGEIYAATGGQGPEWEKAVALGRSIDPANPMYGGAKDEPVAAMATSGSFGVPLAAGAAAAAATDMALGGLGHDKSQPILDLDLGSGANESPTVPDINLDIGAPSSGDLGLDLNLGEADKAAEEQTDFSPSGTFIMDAATKKAVSEMTAAGHSEGGGLSIDFELPDATLEPHDKGDGTLSASQGVNVIDFDFKLDEPKHAAPAMDLSGLSLDLSAQSGDAAPADARWQEVATKLDLAKAYEEMGDKEGARELLNEVLKEGDASQQLQARSMLETLV